MQKKNFRALCFAGHREPSIELFQYLNFLKFEDVYKYTAINFVFKSTNGFMHCDWFSQYENMYNT